MTERFLMRCSCGYEWVDSHPAATGCPSCCEYTLIQISRIPEAKEEEEDPE